MYDWSDRSRSESGSHMSSIVLYFQVHQPYRLKRYSVFDEHPYYFDTDKNREICRKVAEKCYRPAARLLLDLIRRHENRFRLAISLSGAVADQLEAWAPDVLDQFRRLADTGCCEFLAETYDHSLAFIYSREEFLTGVGRHEQRMRDLFSVTPRVFRNTELIYNNDLAHYVHSMVDEDGTPKYRGMLAEGADSVLERRSPARLYRPPHTGAGPDGRPFAVLLKNYRLSDDIAFRFSDRQWSEWPLTARKFASWVDLSGADGPLCNLFMDFETLGEHQWADTGVFEFLGELPDELFALPGREHDFLTPSEAIERYEADSVFDAPEMVSWADSERDLSAWLGNAMQSGAQSEVFRLGRDIRRAAAEADASGDPHTVDEARRLVQDWRRLTASDHFYYMSTKSFADGEVHKYFNPYDSPYDAYINYMNVLDNARGRLASLTEGARAAPSPV